MPAPSLRTTFSQVSGFSRDVRDVDLVEEQAREQRRRRLIGAVVALDAVLLEERLLRVQAVRAERRGRRLREAGTCCQRTSMATAELTLLTTLPRRRHIRCAQRTGFSCYSTGPTRGLYHPIASVSGSISGPAVGCHSEAPVIRQNLDSSLVFSPGEAADTMFTKALTPASSRPSLCLAAGVAQPTRSRPSSMPP